MKYKSIYSVPSIVITKIELFFRYKKNGKSKLKKANEYLKEKIIEEPFSKVLANIKKLKLSIRNNFLDYYKTEIKTTVLENLYEVKNSSLSFNKNIEIINPNNVILRLHSSLVNLIIIMKVEVRL